jgi:hypothetical protein
MSPPDLHLTTRFMEAVKSYMFTIVTASLNCTRGLKVVSYRTILQSSHFLTTQYLCEVELFFTSPLLIKQFPVLYGT